MVHFKFKRLNAFTIELNDVIMMRVVMGTRDYYTTYPYTPSVFCVGRNRLGGMWYNFGGIICGLNKKDTAKRCKSLKSMIFSVKSVKSARNLSSLRQRRHAPPRIHECLAQVASELRFVLRTRPTHPLPTHPSNN